MRVAERRGDRRQGQEVCKKERGICCEIVGYGIVEKLWIWE